MADICLDDVALLEVSHHGAGVVAHATATRPLKLGSAQPFALQKPATPSHVQRPPLHGAAAAQPVAGKACANRALPAAQAARWAAGRG